MSKRKTGTLVPKTPKVRLAMPKGRCWEVRYTDPVEKREIRISTGTRDLEQAQVKLAEVSAKLLLGIEAKPRQASKAGPSMLWEDFRHDYTRLKVATFRSEKAKDAAEYRLDICEGVINPRTLGQMAKPETLAKLQAELLAGTGSTRLRPRSPHTVRSYVTTLIAALNWAHKPMKWLPEPIEFTKLECDDPDKGRPLCGEEFDRMLAAVPKVLSPEDPSQADAAAVESWRFLLRGLWESGLRLGEALAVSWDIDGTIVPHFPKKGRPYLHIPSKMQKNRKAQNIPMTPAFAAMLEPIGSKTGYVFAPYARRGQQRLTQEQVGRTISLFGEKAGIVVSATGKYASAHDLRRSFAKRLAAAGVPIRALQALMRHSSVTTTEAYYLDNNAQDQAELLAKYLGTIAPAQESKQAAEAS